MNIYQKMKAHLCEDHNVPDEKSPLRHSILEPPTETWSGEYHEVPDEWLDDARRFKRHLIAALVTDPDLLLSVRPAYKGGWKRGYSWSGSYKIKIRNNKPEGYCAGQEFSFYARTEDLKPIERWYGRVKERLDTEAMGIKVVALYRRSGIIPKHIAKRYAVIIRQKIGGEVGSYYANREATNMAIKMAARYIRHYAKCPDCGTRRSIMEHLTGYICTHCQGEWEDIHLNNLHWESRKKSA